MKKKHGWRWWDCILVVLILLLFVAIGYGSQVCQRQEQQIRELSSDLQFEKAQRQMEHESKIKIFADQLQAQRQLQFYEDCIGLIDESDKRYHAYGCEDFDDTFFWGYNVEQLEQMGYRPCPKCR